MRESRMISCGGKDLRDGFNCGVSGSVEDGEVEVSGVAVLTDVDETKRSATFEDKASTIFHVRPVQLRDDVSEDIIALHDRRIDTVGISTTSDLVPSEHGSVVDYGAHLVNGSIPFDSKHAVGPHASLVTWIQVNHRLPWTHLWIEVERQIERVELERPIDAPRHVHDVPALWRAG